jgi:hypothetical protein
MQTFDVAIPIPAFQRLSRRHAIDRAEARWRSMDPTCVPAFGRYVMALQKLRRQDTRLAKQPGWAILFVIWRYLFGPPPRALMRPTMAANDDDHVIFLSGWSFTESTGRWTDGPLAVLAIQRAPGRRGTFLRLEAQTIHAEPNKPQVIDVRSGWRHLARLSWEAGAPGTHVIPLPSALYEREVLTVLLHVRSPIAPADIGLSPDRRRLGLYLRDIRSSHCVRDPATAALDLRHGSSDLAVLWNGWSTPEPEGCWTDGPDASLRWTSPRDLPADVRLVIRGASLRLAVRRSEDQSQLMADELAILVNFVECPVTCRCHSALLPANGRSISTSILTTRVLRERPAFRLTNAGSDCSCNRSTSKTARRPDRL